VSPAATAPPATIIPSFTRLMSFIASSSSGRSLELNSKLITFWRGSLIAVKGTSMNCFPRAALGIIPHLNGVFHRRRLRGPLHDNPGHCLRDFPALTWSVYRLMASAAATNSSCRGGSPIAQSRKPDPRVSTLGVHARICGSHPRATDHKCHLWRWRLP
jgi:hypothetical protein